MVGHSGRAYSIPYHPWDERYIYLYMNGAIFMGKNSRHIYIHIYNRPMDAMGIVISHIPLGDSDFTG